MSDEKYIFQPETKKKIVYTLIAGIVLLVIGILTDGSGGHAAEEGHALNVAVADNMVASNTSDAIAVAESAEGEHHGSPHWLKRLYTNLWLNNVYFTGFAIIGLFFVAIQYAASAGWSAPIKRIPLSMARTWESQSSDYQDIAAPFESLIQSIDKKICNKLAIEIHVH